MMKRALNLTDEQVQRLEPVMKEQQAKFAALRRDTGLSRREKVAKVKEIRAAADARMKTILTPEQAERWQKMRPGEPPNAPPRPPQQQPPGTVK